MPDLTTRRDWLLAAIRAFGRPVPTADAEQLLAGTSWSCHRNTARKDLRALARRGHLTSTATGGRTIYLPKDPA